MLEFKIGDKVKINEAGHHDFGEGLRNPRGAVGKVIDIDDGFGEELYQVIWPECFRNYYREGTLDKARPTMLENE